ncbi:MAG: DUF4026 domain-containing protein [Phycisphaerales bacterium]|nr:DUF4026 domain-containing protein [Phycisphaerales bacterium]
MELALRTPPEERAWRLRLKHPEWGEAELRCDIEPRPIPEILVKLDPRLTEAERAEARMGGTHVCVEMTAQAGHVLRDRKRFLRFLRAVMGSDGVVAADAAAQGFWSRASLDEELAHDADLDVTALYSIHAVHGPVGERVNWLHTHGLDRVDGFDFDILEPASQLLSNASDVLRSIAFAILEGDARPDTPAFHLAHPGGLVGFVRAAEFQRRASKEYTSIRADSVEEFDANRSVLCEPRSGAFARWLRRIRPSAFLSNEISDGLVFRFSSEATHLMGERARATVSAFAALREEFSEFELPSLVKLGYPVDGARKKSDREHLWFQVHSVGANDFDAELVNEPHAVSTLSRGDRRRHSVQLLTDWVILTPAGPINPRDLAPARRLREHGDELRSAMKRRRSPAPDSPPLFDV